LVADSSDEAYRFWNEADILNTLSDKRFFLVKEQAIGKSVQIPDVAVSQVQKFSSENWRV
jgi:hypothetical protein